MYVMRTVLSKLWVVCCILAGAFFLQGCSWNWMKTSVDSMIDTIIKKDQQKQQWFSVSKEDVYANFREEAWYIGLKSMGLVEVPDFCWLLDEVDHPKVRTINLQWNKIKLVNQDLSCLLNLETVNISFNEVTAVRTLWELPALKNLKLQKNKITSLINFPEFKALENLSLSFNDLKDTAGIENLKNLVTLELAHNQIEELVWLDNMEKLQALKVEFNKLKDLNWIEDLKNLEFVSAARNQLKAKLLEEMNEMNESFLNKILGNSDGAIDWIPVIELPLGWSWWSNE